MAKLEYSLKREHRSAARISYTCIPDRVILPRARASLPSVLRLTGEHVYTKRRLPENTCFGPVCGVRRDISWSFANILCMTSPKHQPVFILPDIQKQCAVHIDVSDESKSNWLHYTRRAPAGKATLNLQRLGTDLYVVTTGPLPPGTELTIADYTSWNETNFNFEYPEACSLICYECNESFDMAEDIRVHVCKEVKSKADASEQIRQTPQPCQGRTTPTDYIQTTKELGNIENRHSLLSPEIGTRFESPKSDVEKNLDQITGAFAKVALDSKKNESKKRRVCIFCKYAAKSRKEYGKHIEHHRQGDGLYHCLQCVKTHKSYSRLQKHCSAKHGGEHHVCPHCSRAFSRRSACDAHMITHSDVRRFVCECGRAFKQKHKLVEHVRKCSNTKKKSSKKCDRPNSPFMCFLCKNGFKRRGMLVNHMLRRHGGIVRAEVGPPPDLPARDYHCPYCTRVYRTKAKRNKHTLRHHPGEPVPKDDGVAAARPAVPGIVVKCPDTQCGREYTSRSRLNRHIVDRHLGGVRPHAGIDYTQATLERQCQQNASTGVQPLPAYTPSNTFARIPAETNLFTPAQTSPSATDVPGQQPTQTSSTSPAMSDVTDLATPAPPCNVVPPGTTILFVPADQHAELFGSQIADGMALSLEMVGEGASGDCHPQIHYPQYN